MVVDNLDLRRSARTLRPLEKEPPLHIDADAELPGPGPLQTLKPIAGQSSQLFKARCRIKNFEPLVGLTVKTLKLSDERSACKGFGPFVAETDDHQPM